MGTPAQHDDQRAFWDAKARTFPRYEEGDDNYEAGVLRTIREHGVDFGGRTVLDVGSGSGMYTLRLAREARSVTAVDISPVMLDILARDAAGLGVGNIEYVCSDWMDFRRGETYDVVFCSMTPAIQSDESREKLLGHAHGWTVFMGFAGVMRSDVMAGLLARYGLEPKVMNNGPQMREWLVGRGLAPVSVILDGQWVVPKSLDAALDACSTTLTNYGVTPDQELLREHLASFEERPGVYVERTDYKIELLLWEK
jgi:SAM-dependent methyltransferase